MLELKGISKSYTTGEFTQQALKNINLKFRKNEFVAILGPSGSGKTTMLNIVGGLVGYGLGQIENCYNYGKVTSASFAGGIIGINYTMGNVIKCYNTGNIDGDSNIGGIVGINKGTVSSSYNIGKVNALDYRAGGICGQNSTDSYIYSCYNIGEIKAENNPGGIVGGDFGTITNCYYLNSIIEGNDEQAKTEEELKLMSSELGDDFSEDTQNINNGYPVLSWQSNF